MVKKLILSSLFILCLVAGSAQEILYKRVQVEYTHAVMLSISKLGISIDFLKDDKWAILEIPETDLQKISNEGISYEVLIDDLARYYVGRNRGYDPKLITEQFRAVKEYSVPAGFALGSMGGFCSYPEMLQHLDNMASTYPGLITQKQAIGTQLTVEGRPLYWIKISDNPGINEEEPEVLYTGLTHAREPGSMQLLLFYMYYLLENYATNPEIKALVDNTEMYFVPCVNPDGYLYNQTTNPNGGGQWRKNRKNSGSGNYGIDLNRNFGYKWGYDNIGSSPVASSLTYRGTEAFSEAETQIIKGFCLEHDFKIALNYHTYGNYLLYSWGYTANPSTNDINYFEAIGKEMSVGNNFRVGTPVSVLYLVNGEANDWMYGEQTSKPGFYALTPEVGSQTDGFWPLMPRIIPQCFETLNQNITVAKLAGPYYLLNDLSTFNISSHAGYFSFEAERLGVTDAPFTVSIQGLTSHFTGVGNAKTYNGLQRLGKITDSIAFALRPGIVPGEQIKFVLRIESGMFVKADTITKTFGNAEFLFSDDCSTMTNWESTKWNKTNAAFHSASFSITDSPGTSYATNETSAITLKNAVNLSGAASAWLTFYTKWALDGAADYVKLEASSDAGQTWAPVSGKYSSHVAVQGLPTHAIYIGKQTAWVKECVDLTAFCGSQILLKFTIITDGSTVKDGFYFDDMKIERIDGAVNSQEYFLPFGWSSLSSYLIPEKASLDEIFAGNHSQIVIVKDGNGGFFEPGNPENTLSTWNSQLGYTIKTTQNTAFTLNGFPETYRQLSLGQGWNLVPALIQTHVLISEIQVNPPGSIELIKDAAGLNSWWPEMGNSSLRSLLPGKSYFIKLKNNAVLSFP